MSDPSEQRVRLKEGDIIEVPYGPTLVPKRGPKRFKKKKGRETGFTKKFKEVEDEAEEVYKDIEEEALFEEWEAKQEELGRAGEIEAQKEEREAEEEHEGYEDRPYKADIFFEEDPDVKESKEPFAPRRGERQVYEKGVEFFEKNVLKYQGAELDLAERLGIPLREDKLVPKVISRRIYETEAKYAGTLRLKVGPMGVLLPVVGEKRRVELLEDVPIVVPPHREYGPKPKEPNPYNAMFPFGTYVSFEGDQEDLEGIVMSFDEEGANVAVSSTTVKGEMHHVEYDQLSIAERPKHRKLQVQRPPAMVDIYGYSEIPEPLRRIVVSTYIKILKDVRVKKPAPKSKTLEATTIRWEILNNPPIQFDPYYADNFKRWIRARYHQSFVDAVDGRRNVEMAEEMMKKESDPDVLIYEIVNLVPGGLTDQITAKEVLDLLREKKDLTLFEARLIQSLQAEVVAKRGGLSGEELAKFFKDEIDRYFELYPPNFDTYYKLAFDASVEEQFSRYHPTDQDRVIFEQENLEVLKTLHSQRMEEYEKEKVKADTIQREMEIAAERVKIKEVKKEAKFQKMSPEAKERVMRAKDIGEEDEEIEYQVKRFEQIIFAAQGSSVYRYMINVLVPYAFLDGQLAAHAKFFRSKLANGSFDFSALVGANLAHYLPELAMNQTLTDAQWLSAGVALGALLRRQADDTIDLFIAFTNPTARRQLRVSVPARLIEEKTIQSKIIAFLKTPTSVCMKDSGTGMRPVVRDGMYVSDQYGELIMEPISEGELVICYSDNKFTCHSVEEVLKKIATKDLINPYTGKPFPKEFIDKIGYTYRKRIADPELLREIKDRDIIPPKERKPEKVVSPKRPSKPKVNRVRHKPQKKKAFMEVERMVVVGDLFQQLTLFSSDFEIPLKGGITKNVKVRASDPDSIRRSKVVVLAFDASNPSSIDDLRDLILPPKAKVYVVGVNSNVMAAKDRVIFSNRVKKVVPQTEKVFYAEDEDEGSLVDALTDVVIDVEGVEVV